MYRFGARRHQPEPYPDPVNQKQRGDRLYPLLHRRQADQITIEGGEHLIDARLRRSDASVTVASGGSTSNARSTFVARRARGARSKPNRQRDPSLMSARFVGAAPVKPTRHNGGKARSRP
jgi:hypothetical protein